MAFIGNQPISVAFLVDTFSGTGSQTAFTMTVAPANTSSIIVAITGVLQDPSTYSVSGTTLTFSAAPPSGTSNISVRYLGIPASGVTTTAYRTVTNFTATAAQTSFSVPSYTVGYIDVYRNGVRLVSTDFTATTGTTVVLVNACTSGDSVVTESFLVSSVLNAIPNSPASVGTSNIVSGVTLTSPTLTSPAISTIINGAGTLTLPTTSGTVLTTANQNYFYAHRTSNQGSVSSSTWTQVNLDNALQSGSSFNTSTYTWTATAAEAGVWMFTGQVSFYVDANNGSQCNAGLYYNGSLDAGNYSFIPGAATGNIRHFTGQVQTLKTISSGDTMKLYGYVVGTTNAFFGGDGTGGYRQCSLIGVKIA